MKATKISQMRDQLAEHEITEVWPSKAYKALCEQCGEEGWLDEEEIRTYFAELDEAEVQAVYAETFGEEPRFTFTLVVRDRVSVILAAHDEVMDLLPWDEIVMSMEEYPETVDTVVSATYSATLSGDIDQGADIVKQVLGMVCFDGIQARWVSEKDQEEWTHASGTLRKQRPEVN